MKRISYFLLSIILLVPILVSAEASDNEKIRVKAITVKEQSAQAEEKNKATIIDDQINLDIKFKEEGDFITYDVFLENTSNEDYELNTDKLVMNSDYVEYQLESNDKEIKANEGKVIQLKVSYKHGVPKDKTEKGSYQDSKDMNVPLITNEKITNPNTGRSHTIFSILCIIAGCAIIWKTTRDCNSKKTTTAILLITCIMIPATVSASYRYNMKIHSVIMLEDEEKICIIEGKGTCTSRIEGENIKKRLLTREDFNTYLENVSEPNETTYDFIKNQDLEANDKLALVKVERNNVLTEEEGCYVFSYLETC